MHSLEHIHPYSLTITRYMYVNCREICAVSFLIAIVLYYNNVMEQNKQLMLLNELRQSYQFIQSVNLHEFYLLTSTNPCTHGKVWSFGVLCCLTTPGLRKDIRRQIRQLYSHKITYYVHYNYILSSHLLSHFRIYFYY